MEISYGTKFAPVVRLDAGPGDLKNEDDVDRRIVCIDFLLFFACKTKREEWWRKMGAARVRIKVRCLVCNV